MQLIGEVFTIRQLFMLEDLLQAAEGSDDCFHSLLEEMAVPGPVPVPVPVPEAGCRLVVSVGLGNTAG